MNPNSDGLGHFLIGPIVILAMIALVLMSALWGCAPAQPVGMTDADGVAVVTTFPLVTYSAEFSTKVSRQLRAAPPELSKVVVDYLKLRCAIKPDLPYCADLLR